MEDNRKRFFRGRVVTNVGNVGKFCGQTPCLTRAINMFKLFACCFVLIRPAKILKIGLTEDKV